MSSLDRSVHLLRGTSMHPSRSIVAFSHLRWDFVYQRPQHLLSRLARGSRVAFVEEPVHDPDAEPRWDIHTPCDGVQVFRPVTPEPTRGFSPEQLRVMEPLMEELREKIRPRVPAGELVAWLYTPLALPLAQQLEPELVVYDCMDELSLFLGAPRELFTRETELFERADLVFTGGRSLFRAKQHRHPDIHCFLSSVDAGHFARPRPGAPALPVPQDQAVLPRSRVGYFGVIDERIDLTVLDALASAHPEWRIVLVGPVVKIDPATLPRHPNIVYTGQRDYKELPAYLSGRDVCLLPFALNDATRYISPTKILEYMAAER